MVLAMPASTVIGASKYARQATRLRLKKAATAKPTRVVSSVPTMAWTGLNARS
jgi:hypothetical protein